MFQHHIQVPGASHIIASRGRYPNLFQHGIHPAFRDEDMVGNDGFIILPPTAKGEGLGCFVTVYIEGDGKFRSQLRLYPQQFQYMGVGGGFVGIFLWQAALDGVTVHPVGIVGIGIAHLHMGFVEGNVRGHSQETPQAPLGDQRVFP